MDWAFLALFFGGAAAYAWRQSHEERQATARARALGLAPARDLTHLPGGLPGSALWHLADGGFEGRVLRGKISTDADDVDLTAFDLETLRERRGEWAYLPVERPFRLRGVVTVVVSALPGPVPHILCKHDGRGDELTNDDWIERELSVAKSARQKLGLAAHHPAELPANLAENARALSPGWRAYVRDEIAFAELVQPCLAPALARVQMRDLVIELLDHSLIAYPATRDALGVDGFAELCSAAARVTAAVRRALATGPRGG